MAAFKSDCQTLRRISLRVALLNLQGQRFVNDGDRSGSNLLVTIVQKRCTTFKAPLVISSTKCNGQWGKREVQGCSGLMVLHWKKEHDLKWRSTAEFPCTSTNHSTSTTSTSDKYTQHCH
jgi:hypothetical protein